MSALRYDNPQALRQALADRLRPLAEASGMELFALLRQFAYDRLLCRVFSTDPERWVLKGATAMLARLEGRARHTLDVDLYRRDGSLADAERALREAAAVDLGDYFRFTLGAAKRMAQGADALRIPVVAFLGVTEFRETFPQKALPGDRVFDRQGINVRHARSGGSPVLEGPVASDVSQPVGNDW